MAEAWENTKVITDYVEETTPDTTDAILIDQGSGAYKYATLANIRGTVDAGDLTGTELKSTVVTSSLTSVGTLSSLVVSGNVGIGVTPETLQNLYAGVQVGGNSVISGTKAEGAGSVITIANNMKYAAVDSSTKQYISTDEASRFYQFGGGFYFEGASSGNANTTIMFDNLMQVRLDGLFINTLDGSTGGSDVRFNTSTKELFYDTSSLRYKENVRDEVDSDWIYDIKVKTYDRKDGSRRNEIGIIAEDLALIKPSYVAYKVINEKEIHVKKALRENNKDMSVKVPEPIIQPETYSKSDLVPLVISELQKLNKRVLELEGK